MFGILHIHARRRVRPPTPVTSYAHAREQHHSVLPTCLPLRPSNYQSDGRRRAASWSGVSSRATAEGAATTYTLKGTTVLLIKQLFIHMKAFQLRTRLLHDPSLILHLFTDIKSPLLGLMCVYGCVYVYVWFVLPIILSKLTK